VYLSDLTFSQVHIYVHLFDLTFSQDHVCVHLSDLTFSQNHVRVHLLNLIFSPVHVYVYLRDPHACVHVLHSHVILHSKNDKDFTSNDSGNCTERRSDLGVSDKHEHKCARRSNLDDAHTYTRRHHVCVYLSDLTFSQVHIYVHLFDLTFSQDHVCVHLSDLTFSQNHVHTT
jgi:hypothetical protein